MDFLKTNIDKESFFIALDQPVQLDTLGFLTEEHRKVFRNLKRQFSTYDRFCGTLKKCAGCKIHYERIYDPVLPQGDPSTAIFVFIGRNPGRLEGEHGIPFYPQAKAGSLFNIYLRALGIERKDIYLTNALFCYTRDDRAPEVKERVRCSFWKPLEFSFLERAKFFFLLGDDAYKQVTGQTSGISRNYGHPFFLKTKHGVKYFFPVFHPGYLLRNRTDGVVVAHHLKSINENFLKPFKMYMNNTNGDFSKRLQEWEAM